MFRELNNAILKEASKLDYIVKPYAPNDISAVLNQTQLVIWDGASNNTIWQNAIVNYAFRALHDRLHQITGLDFTPEHEIELGRIQASQYDGLMADLVYCEVSMQAQYYLTHNKFIEDQVTFTANYMDALGYRVEMLM